MTIFRNIVIESKTGKRVVTLTGTQHETTNIQKRGKREERAQRILNAAADLLLRYGYTKTTVDDIARQAHVAKGTIYLHWKTREELFLTLAAREGLETSLETLQLVANDPQGALLSRLIRHSLAVMLRRPLARALYLSDTEVLGGMLRLLSEQDNSLIQQKLDAWDHMLSILREKGLLRTDDSPEQQLYICTATVIGFLTADNYLPTEMRRPPDAQLDALEQTIRRTLEPEQAPDPQVLQEVGRVLQDLYHTYLDAAQQWFRHELQ